ncbi:ornithine cyclodeaminase [Streptococcus porcinus]|uniref:Ornithine cyclodeaminase n=2 Tax=Streptococcus porcinus TaxID=1340 RepID=A0A4V0H3J0_STRPO|nr:ornithine cyclodeaminase [Streptococcus porcinus]EGJ27325.1 ornithine cyclodeaminase/mu-crystallin family protein [Streptococcus porcinus str. Jelinkova 176]SQG44186.1 ornithine cyclodeaminase [Streptococcus porcinus]VTT43690.1 ornithine cyclodeaminase [Streptococcus porcinus]VTT45069.1 ornithine cyclodeaminase [Streptococcus porcinus]
MLILSKNDMEQCFSMAEAIKVAKEASKIYTEGHSIVPLRTNLEVTDYNGQSLYMPAVTSGMEKSLGVKIVSVYPDNINKGLPSVPATMVTLDPQTGIVSAVLDGTYLTQLRTAAIQGAATEELANKEAKIAGLIGTGGQAYQQALAMMTARKLDELKVFDIDYNRAVVFAEKLTNDIRDTFHTSVYAVDSAKEVVANSDIVTTVTTSKNNTFDANDIGPGTHINGIGAYTPEMFELPKELLIRANTVLFDTTDAVLAEAGDIQAPINEGLLTPTDYSGELGELLLGRILGRQSKSDITVFKSVGSAVFDVVTAQRIVERALEKGVGTSIDF